MSEETLPKYKNPRWVDKENRRIWCEILVNDKYHQCNINVGNPSEGLINKDYDALLELYSEEEIDQNTELFDKEGEENQKRAEEAREVHINRVKQETLFEMKLEAFEIETIKNSKNKELKKCIRKAKTLIEVQAYSTMILQEEFNSNEHIG